MRGMMEAVGSNLRPAPLFLVAGGANVGAMDQDEMRRLETEVLDELSRLFRSGATAKIRRLHLAGSGLGQTYWPMINRLQRRCRLYGIPGPLDGPTLAERPRE
jgi:hypothetical protein